jgi:hypothetical protein
MNRFSDSSATIFPRESEATRAGELLKTAVESKIFKDGM